MHSSQSFSSISPSQISNATTHDIDTPHPDSQTLLHSFSLSESQSTLASQQDPPDQDIPRDTTSSPISLATSNSSMNSSVSLSPTTTMSTCPSSRRTLLDAAIEIHDLGSKVQKEASDFSPTSHSDGLTPTQESFPSAPGPPAPAVSRSEADGAVRTPNVYINGLPPDFPEDQLLAMTQEFGEVLSVRTFTRHVSEKPSGYGFVLFGSIEAAEKCIETLQKYRNLHPSFSKQIHKIPGTVYASAQAQVPSVTENPDSFKARMERLKDNHSTNLYMEGLPISIDEPTLAALVSPYKIMSSRFFQTRLSTPPRIIAFVRLESREAAEEVIERLHGRMVRGWRDAGSRISVRFADTSEQRELRRAERMSREGDNSPGKLTMAHAALLSMKGNQLPEPHNQRLHNAELLSPTLSPELLLSPNDFQSRLPPPVGLHHQQEPRYTPQELSVLRASSSHPRHSSQQLNAQAADFSGVGLRMPAHVSEFDETGDISQDLLQQLAAHSLESSLRGLPTRADHGFTPAERLLLQAHAQRQRGAQITANQASEQSYTVFNASAPEFNPSAATLGRLGFASNHRDKGRRLVDILPSMSEEDFHATRGGHSQVLRKVTDAKIGLPSHIARDRLALDFQTRLAFSRQRNQTCSADTRLAADIQTSLHNRSTTVPSPYNSHLGGPNNNIQPSTSHDFTLRSNTRNHSAEGRSVSDFPRTGTGDYMSRANGTSTDTPNLAFSQPKASRPNKFLPRDRNRIDTGVNTRHESLNQHISHDADDEDEGSSQDLPALSYSTRTPASLSPATPASAFGESFDGPPMTVSNSAGAGGQVGLGMDVNKGENPKQRMSIEC